MWGLTVLISRETPQLGQLSTQELPHWRVCAVGDHVSALLCISDWSFLVFGCRISGLLVSSYFPRDSCPVCRSQVCLQEVVSLRPSSTCPLLWLVPGHVTPISCSLQHTMLRTEMTLILKASPVCFVCANFLHLLCFFLSCCIRCHFPLLMLVSFSSLPANNDPGLLSASLCVLPLPEMRAPRISSCTVKAAGAEHIFLAFSFKMNI